MLQRHYGATICKSRLEESKMHQSSRQNAVATMRQQSHGINLSRVRIACLSLLVFVGSAASANQWSYPADPGFVATNPSQVAAAIASWETPEYGNYTGHDPSTTGTAVNWPWQ